MLGALENSFLISFFSCNIYVFKSSISEPFYSKMVHVIDTIQKVVSECSFKIYTMFLKISKLKKIMDKRSERTQRLLLLIQSRSLYFYSLLYQKALLVILVYLYTFSYIQQCSSFQQSQELNKIDWWWVAGRRTNTATKLFTIAMAYNIYIYNTHQLEDILPGRGLFKVSRRVS